MKYDDQGRELPDPRPMEVPLNFRRPKSLNEIVGELVARQVRELAQAQGAESFEEADDFDVGDEDEPVSPLELTAMQEEFELPDADQPGYGGRAPISAQGTGSPGEPPAANPPTSSAEPGGSGGVVKPPPGGENPPPLKIPPPGARRTPLGVRARLLRAEAGSETDPFGLPSLQKRPAIGARLGVYAP